VVTPRPDDFELDSVRRRLRAGARAVFSARGASPAMRARHPDVADYDDAMRERRDKARADLRELGYSEEAYETDRRALHAALLAAARTCGEVALERIEEIADDFRIIYLTGPDAHANIGVLLLAIRNWLPFVSFSPYLQFYDEVPPVPEMTEVEPLPEMSMVDGAAAAPEPPAVSAPGGDPSEQDLLALAEQGDKVAIMKALWATAYMPWRTPEKNVVPTDARQLVLADVGESDRDLRARLYLDHPILLIVQYLSPPGELKHRVPPLRLQQILLSSANERELALRHVVELCIQHLREASDTLRGELADNDVDWSRFRPLVTWAAAVIGKDEPQGSVVRGILDEIVSEVASDRDWTARDSLAVAAIVVGVVLAVASLYVGGIVGIALGIADFAIQTTAVHAHELLTERQNVERDLMNRAAYVDATLAIASDPETSDLGWWLGLVSLVTLPATVSGVAAGAASFMRGRALGRARDATARALAAADRGSMDAAATRLRVPPQPLVQAPRVAPEMPVVDMPSPAVDAPTVPRDTAPPPQPDALPVAAPATKSTAESAGRAPEPEPDPDLAKPRAKPSRPVDDPPDESVAGFVALSNDPQAQVISEMQELIEATKTENERMELERALEDGLARMLKDNPNPEEWGRLVRDLEGAGYLPDDISRMREAANRGLLRRYGVEPARTGRGQAMQGRLQKHVAASSAQSKADDDAAAARATQSKAVQRPDTGHAISSAEKGKAATSIPPKSTSQAPKGWPVRQIDPANLPDLVPNGVVLEFPTGERVWRTAGSDRAIVIESTLGPSSGRHHFEQDLFSRGEMDLAYTKALMERAHSQGQGTGFESPFAITYAPAEVNQELQNLGIEEFLRTLYQDSTPGVTYKLITSTRIHPHSRRLALIEYKIVAEIDGKARELFTTGIRVSGSANESVVTLAEDLTHVDPEAFALLPINDLDPSIVQRRREMFERLRARRRN
jgi:hypothetical protein